MNKHDLIVIFIIFISISILVFPILFIADLLNYVTPRMTIITIGNTIAYLLGVSILIASHIHYYFRNSANIEIYNVQKTMNLIRALVLIFGLLLFPYSLEHTFNLFGWIILSLSISNVLYGHSFQVIGNRVAYSNEKSSSSYRIMKYSNVRNNVIEIQLENDSTKTIVFNKKEINMLRVITKKLDQADADC